MPNRLYTTVLLLICVSTAGSVSAETHLDDVNSLAMFTAMREICAEKIPDLRDYFSKSRYKFELMNYHRLLPIRGTSEYVERLEQYKKELLKPENGLDAKNCMGMTTDTSSTMLVAPDTGKPIPLNH